MNVSGLSLTFFGIEMDRFEYEFNNQKREGGYE